MKNKSIALLLYGESGSSRDALTDDKYKVLAASLKEAGFSVESVLYHDSTAKETEERLLGFSAILVWVNPIEQGRNRKILDAMLINVADRGIPVYSHPDAIMKIGTKKVLYTSRSMDWGLDTEMYTDYISFKNSFHASLKKSGIRVLKQYRGNGGNGVYKISYADDNFNTIKVIHAPAPAEEKILSIDKFHLMFEPYFENEELLVNQAWAEGLGNGVVRAYITGKSVSGFGYQESNALNIQPVSSRFYFSEDCGLFQDLRKILEEKWIRELQKIHSLPDDKMPILWDLDFFINDVNTSDTAKKYSLCEINVSCVSPFPVSCVNHIIDALRERLN